MSDSTSKKANSSAKTINGAMDWVIILAILLTLGAASTQAQSQDDQGDTRDTATSLAFGPSAGGELGTDDTDYFRLILGARSAVAVWTEGTTNTEDGLTDADGNELVFNADISALRERGVDVVLSRDGEYLRTPILSVAPRETPAGGRIEAP